MRALALLAASALAGCRLLTGEFHLAGTVRIDPSLERRTFRDGEMLFIVAENEGGVPLAVHRIVNPVFPSEFSMGPEDLLVPSVRRFERLKVHAEMNAHGDLGDPRPGDLEGDAPSSVLSGSKDISVTLDRVE